MPTLGYRPSASGGPDAAILDPDTTLAYVADAPAENGWLHQMAGRFSRPDAGTPTAELGTYSTASGNPSELLGDTVIFAVTTTVEGEYVRDLDEVVLLRRNVPVSFAVHAQDARLRIDMAGAMYVPSADNKTFYWDDGVELHEDFTIDASSYEGQLAIWGVYEANVGPDAPTNCTPGSTSESSPTASTDTTPTFAGDFRDDNETVGSFAVGAADAMRRVRVQVYRHDTGALLWDSGARDTSTAEETARRFALTYDGPTLPQGVTLRWRATVADRFDAWSPVSSWRYLTVGAGKVVGSTPAGKTNTRTPGPFVATWTHVGGLATNAVELRLRNQTSGATIRASATLGLTVSPGGTISVSWATTGFTSLPWDDARLIWEMRARDTANVWSGWSAGLAFWTNDPPTVPAPYAPAAGAVVTSYPLLQVTVSDTDDSGTGITVTFRIMNAAGTVLQTRTGSYNSGTGRYQYQVVAADFTGGFADYLWDAYAFDGVVYSGGVTSAGSAQTSADRRVTYASGPVVTITAPADNATITTNTPTLTWTCPTQSKRQVQVLRSGVFIHDTGTVTTASKTYTLPALLSTGEQLHELDDVVLRVTCTDTNDLIGVDGIGVTLDYPQPPALQPSVLLVNGRGDLTPSVVRISWPASTYAVDDFRYYRLERRISADMLAANPSLPSTPVVFKRFEITQTRFDDYEATSGVEYTYSLRQYVTQGADTLASSSRSATIALFFEATILHAVDDPESKRLVFDARRDRTIETVTDFAVVSPWNQQKPVQFESNVYYHEITTEWVLVAKTPQDANYDLVRLERMVRDGAIINYRDGRGNNFYGRFSTPPTVLDPPGGRMRTVRGTFRELAYDPSAKD